MLQGCCIVMEQARAQGGSPTVSLLAAFGGVLLSAAAADDDEEEEARWPSSGVCWPSASGSALWSGVPHVRAAAPTSMGWGVRDKAASKQQRSVKQQCKDLTHMYCEVAPAGLLVTPLQQSCLNHSCAATAPAHTRRANCWCSTTTQLCASLCAPASSFSCS